MYPILPWAYANLCELLKCYLEFLTIQDRLIGHLPFPKWPFRCQITDLSSATIDYEIPLLETGSDPVSYRAGLGNLPDVLPWLVIIPFCCRATLLLPHPHGFCWLLAHSNTCIPSLEADMLTWHLDWITICNDRFQQPEGITTNLTFSTMVNDWVVDIECSLLYTSIGSIEFIVMSDAMQLQWWVGRLEGYGDWK